MKETSKAFGSQDIKQEQENDESVSQEQLDDTNLSAEELPEMQTVTLQGSSVEDDDSG